MRAKRLKQKGIYLLYRLIQAFGCPAVLFYLLLRGVRQRAYWASLKQRAGFLPPSFRQTVPGAIWLHAVSVGEVIAASGFVRRLREQMPRSPVFVSVSTLAGYELASRTLAGLANVFYAPIDYVSPVRRVLRTLRPALVIVMETEIWPNLFREVKRTGAGLLVANARISDRAVGRYVTLRWFFDAVLAQPDLILAQSEAMRQRLILIGAPPHNVRVGGNLKYDSQPCTAPPDSPVRHFIARVEPSAVWIAASTMPPAVTGEQDEDETVVAAFQQACARHPRLLLLLAPRKPERFDPAAQLLARTGVPFIRRSALTGSATLPLPGALLLDSIGELAGLFPLANVVFMGGSLVARGGHNILEPALFARPIISGPHLENFADIAAAFHAAGALAEVTNSATLATAVIEILDDLARAADLSARAASCARAKQGASTLTAKCARELFTSHLPRYRPAQPAFTFLWILSRLWIWGARLKRARDLARRRRLEVPVISVGNLTVGGTGKTPTVLHLARRLKDAGWAPGILTRGYGRHSPVSHQALAAGAHLPVDQSGDEPQMFLRSGIAPVGIGADRWRVGQLLEREFHVNPIVLDDGFQHARLDRSLDIVLVDALDPLGGGYPVPLGRLREPPEGLSRAGIFVITRSEFGRVADSAEHVLRQYNPQAPIFHARARPQQWVAASNGETLPPDALPFSRVAAFCGLGNPGYFWCTLASLGLDLACRIEFEDHHTYKPRELRIMGSRFREEGVQAILTTEKDMVNLCEDVTHFFAPLPLYWLHIGVDIDREDEFMAAISARLVS